MLSFVSLKAQVNLNREYCSDTLAVNLINRYYLNTISIIPFTEIVILRGEKLSRKDYSIRYTDCSLTLSDSLAYSIFDTLYIYYQSYKLGLKKEYKNRTLVSKIAENQFDSIRVIKIQSNPFSNDAIFGKDLQKSGTIVRGFTVGTNKDFTLNSGLRLQLSGKLSNDIEITAALTDENTPIQPEGNSEKLEELDKVFIEIRHKNAIGTFGDYDYTNKIGEFGNIDRKLQGLKADIVFNDVNGSFAYATSRGKFNTNKLNGIDGVQGPYRLLGTNNERNIVVIAGSEKVFLDGNLQKRGENNDYTIEYANAEITFTPNKLITSASRITIEFEYSDRQYSRTFLGATSNVHLIQNKLSFSFGYYKEGDDKNNPIDLVLSEKDEEILRIAGDDQNKAVRSGATLAEADSLGRIIGSYIKVDTVLAGEPFSYYVYNPGSTNALYNVTFTYVGEGKGDYNSISIGNYVFVGIGSGNYLPIKYLPLPQMKQIGNFYLTYQPQKNIKLSIELAGSIFDKNTFSDFDDKNNNGYARSINFELSQLGLNLFNTDLGKYSLGYKDRYVENRFSSIDRINSVEFDRYYNTSSENNNNEVLREISIGVFPIQNTSINAKYGYLKKGESFSSKRYTTDIKSIKNNTYELEYSFDYVNSKNSSLISDWLRQSGKVNFSIFFIKPGFEFANEIKKDNYESKDSLISSSLKYYEFAPTLNIIEFEGITFSSKYGIRNDYLPNKGIFYEYSKSTTQSYSLEYRGIPEVSTNNVLTFRNLKYTETYKLKGFSDTETILFKSQSRFNFWKSFIDGDLFYETTTEKTAKLERVFLKVQTGTGNYIYLGDLNNNGLPDENEFEQTIYEGDYISTTVPTDELYPVINLKTNTRWKIDFSRLAIDNSFLSSLLKPISTETLFRIEENSKETDLKQIYLLNFSRFLNDSTTIRGSNLFQQDIFLFKNSSELSFKYRYVQKRTLNSYANGNERGYYRENSLTIRFALIKEITNQTEFTTSQDNLSAPVSLNRSRKLGSNFVSSDFSYRPYSMIEVGFILSVGRDEDTYPETPTIIDNNSQAIRFTVSFSGKGRLRIEFERKELVANNTTNNIPFEVTRGNNLGINYIASTNFDYRVGANLQTTINYTGRKLGGSKIIHTLKAEARAFF